MTGKSNMKHIVKIVSVLIIGFTLSADIIYVEGSSTILPVMKQSKKEYFDKEGVVLSIKGGGSSKAIECLLDNRCQIGMLSRELLTEEVQAGINSYPIGYDGIAMIVNKNNPISDITTKEIRDIYMGEITNWKTLNGIDEKMYVLAKQHGRATRFVFDRYFNIQNLGSAVESVGSNIEDIIYVALNKNAISYVSVGSAQDAINNNAEIKMISLNGISPAIGGKANLDYPLIRVLNLTTTKKPKMSVQNIISVIRCDIGKKFISQHNFIEENLYAK